MFCRLLFILLYFFFCPLCCLFFFDLRILITPLVSSNSSWPEEFDFGLDKCKQWWSIIQSLSAKRPRILEHTKTRQTTLYIHVLAWDMYTNVGGLYFFDLWFQITLSISSNMSVKFWLCDHTSSMMYWWRNVTWMYVIKSRIHSVACYLHISTLILIAYVLHELFPFSCGQNGSFLCKV